MRSLIPLLLLIACRLASAYTILKKNFELHCLRPRGNFGLFVTRSIAPISTESTGDEFPEQPRIAKRRYHPNYEKSRYSPTKMRLRSPSAIRPSTPVSDLLRSVNDGQTMTMEQIIHLAKHGAADSAVAAFQNLLSASTEKPAKRPPVSGDSMTSVAALKIRQNVAAPLRQCNMLIKEMADAGQFDRCADVLRAMQSAGVRPSIVTYSTLISRAGAWQKVAVAERYFNQMKHDGIKADVQAYNSLINAYAKETETDRALAVLAEMDREQVKPTVVTFNTLIDSCARSGEVHKAEDMLKRMKERQLVPDERSYSAVVHAHCQAGKPESALLLVKRMEEEGLRPSSYTYSALLHGLGRAGYLDKAFDVLDKMKAQGMRPNVVTMSSLMDACGKHDQIDLALSLYREMLRADGAENKPNSITCSALVDSCLKAGQVERAFAIVQDMHARKLALTEVTYTSLITELTRLKQLDRIMDIVSPSEMKAKGNSISQNSRAAKSSNTQSGAVSTEKTMGSAAGSTGAVSRTGRVGHSTDVFPMSARTLSSTGGSDLQNRSDDASTVKASAPAAATGDVDMDYADMMEMFRGKHDHASVVAVYEGMKSNGVMPSAREYRTLMNSLYEDQLRRAEEAEKVNPASNATTVTYSPGNTSFSSSSSSSSARRDRDHLPSAVNEKSKQIRHNELFRLYLVFQEMRATDVQADVATYNTLINACAGVGDLEKALETVQTMQEDGIAPDIITYTSLMKACSINGGEGTVTLAEEVFAQMQQQTNHFSSYIEPNEFTFQWLMQTHLRAAAYGTVNTKRIWELLDDMIRRGIKPGVSTYRSCVRAAAVDGDVDRALAMLIVIRNSTRMRFDFKSWQIAANLMSYKGLHDEEFKLKKEIEEKKREIEMAQSQAAGSSFSASL